MATLNKVNIPIAVEKKTKLDLSGIHHTTMDFLRPQPIFYRHMLKGEHLNFDCNATIRLSPMPVPTYGFLRCNLRGFAVPYRLVFPQWHNFINDSIGSSALSSSLVSSPPFFTSEDLFELFCASTFSAMLTTSGTSSDYDLYVEGSYYKFTALGRNFLKILESLGYKFISAVKGKMSLTFNALALLAYAKIYLDWYANSQYLNSTDCLYVEKILAYNDPSIPKHLDGDDLFFILNFCKEVVFDDNGYFVNAWDNPVSANNSQYTSLSMYDVTASGYDPVSPSGNRVVTDSNGTPLMAQSVASSTNIGTQYLHDALRRLTDFQKRHQLAGARAIDRTLAQYGIQTDYLRCLRSIYVGSQSIDIKIGDIYATGNGQTSGGDNSVVGDFAGRGAGQGSKSWDYVSDEECIFIVYASIIPTTGYYQGYDRNNRHLDKTDFYQPEFDGLGVQVIEKGEVYVDNTQSFPVNGDSEDYAGVFGFTGRYAEYKRPMNFVTGDLAHFMAGGSSWHLMRNLAGKFADTDDVVHSLQFTLGRDFDFARIFNVYNGEFDPFYCFFHFNAGAYSPCKALTETYDFESESKAINLQSNGANLN